METETIQETQPNTQQAELKALYKNFINKKTIKEILTKTINTKGNKYSLNNLFLCYAQAEQRGLNFQGIMKGFKQYQKENIRIQKGQKALKILIPYFHKIEQKNSKGETEIKEFITFFIGNTFDISQTDSKEYLEAEQERNEKIYKNVELPFNEVLDFVKSNFDKEIIEDYKDIDTKGSFNLRTKNITLHAKDSHTLIHEFSHYLADKYEILDKEKDKATEYAKGEIIAEITAYLIFFKIDSESIKDYNFNYSNIWNSRIEEFNFNDFERIINRIEKVLNLLKFNSIKMIEV